MANPNSTAMRMIGRKLMTGAVTLTPNTLASQPHWNTATTAPSVAPIDRRKPSAALTGTTTERNTISNSTSANPTTSDAKGSSDELSRSDTSIWTAVGPVTETRADVAAR